MRKTIENINVDALMHPYDKQVLTKLNKIPKFKELLNKTVVAFQSTVSDITAKGNGIEVNEMSYPELYRQLLEDCRILSGQDIPQMSLDWGYFISSDSIGGKKPRIVMTSGTIDLLTPGERDFMIGHELGHIMCGHKPYQMLLETLYSPIMNQLDTFNIANIIKMPLLEWYRISHLTADRVGLLCCQDINVAIKTMMKMAGCPKKFFDRIRPETFIKQAQVFESDNGKGLNKLMKALNVRSASMPWMVVRAQELLNWYNSEEYRNLVS